MTALKNLLSNPRRLQIEAQKAMSPLSYDNFDLPMHLSSLSDEVSRFGAKKPGCISTSQFCGADNRKRRYFNGRAEGATRAFRFSPTSP